MESKGIETKTLSVFVVEFLCKVLNQGHLLLEELVLSDGELPKVEKAT